MEGGALPLCEHDRDAARGEAQNAAACRRRGADDPLLAAAAHGTQPLRGADETKALLSERDQLLARLLELQQEHATGESFYPDANGCLRLGAGHVEGYGVGRRDARI